MAKHDPKNGQELTREQAEQAARQGIPAYYSGHSTPGQRPGEQAHQQLNEGRYDSLGRLIVRVITGR
jgi:hypothetical protein